MPIYTRFKCKLLYRICFVFLENGLAYYVTSARGFIKLINGVNLKIIGIDLNHYLNNWKKYSSPTRWQRYKTFFPSSFWHYGIMALWHCGIMALWHYGIVTLWHYGIVALWHYGFMALWHYGIVGLWHYDILALWQDKLECLPSTSWSSWAPICASYGPY